MQSQSLQCQRQRGDSRRIGAGTLCLLLAAFGFSFKSILIKLLYARGIEHDTILIMRFSMSAPLFALALLFREGPRAFRMRLSEFAAISAISIIGILGSTYLSLYAIQRMQASIATVLIFTYPIITILILAFWKRRLPLRMFGISLLALTGLALTLRADAMSLMRDPGALAAAIGAAICFGFYNAAGERFFSGFSPLRLSAFSIMIPTLVLMAGLGWKQYPNDGAAWTLGALLAILSGFLPFYLFMIGLRIVGAGPGTITNSLGPVFNSLWAFLLLGEGKSPWQLLGIGLVLLAVISVRSWPAQRWLRLQRIRARRRSLQGARSGALVTQPQ